MVKGTLQQNGPIFLIQDRIKFMREREGWREKDTNTAQQKQSIRESLKNIIKVLIRLELMIIMKKC